MSENIDSISGIWWRQNHLDSFKGRISFFINEIMSPSDPADLTDLMNKIRTSFDDRRL